MAAKYTTETLIQLFTKQIDELFEELSPLGGIYVRIVYVLLSSDNLRIIRSIEHPKQYLVYDPEAVQ